MPKFISEQERWLWAGGGLLFVSIFLPTHPLSLPVTGVQTRVKGRIDFMEAPGGLGENPRRIQQQAGPWRCGGAGRGGPPPRPRASSSALPARLFSKRSDGLRGAPGVVLPGRGGKELEPEPAGPRKPALRGPGRLSRILGARRTSLP